MKGNLGSAATLLLWLVILIILMGMFFLQEFGNPAIEIPEYILPIIVFFWVGVGLIVYGLNEISIQLNRYDNLKLTQLEKIREELPELENITQNLADLYYMNQSLERIAETLDRIERDLMKHWED